MCEVENIINCLTICRINIIIDYDNFFRIFSEPNKTTVTTVL